MAFDQRLDLAFGDFDCGIPAPSGISGSSRRAQTLRACSAFRLRRAHEALAMLRMRCSLAVLACSTRRAESPRPPRLSTAERALTQVGRARNTGITGRGARHSVDVLPRAASFLREPRCCRGIPPTLPCSFLDSPHGARSAVESRVGRCADRATAGRFFMRAPRARCHRRAHRSLAPSADAPDPVFECHGLPNRGDPPRGQFPARQFPAR
jgi:hypothetical protein